MVRDLVLFLRTGLRPYRLTVAGIVLLQLVQTAAVLTLPTLAAAVIDIGIVRGDVGFVGRIAAVMAGVAVLQVVSSVAAQWLAARVAAQLGYDLRTAVVSRVLSLSVQQVGRFGVPSLITRSVNDVRQVQQLCLALFDVAVTAVVMSLGGLALATALDPWIGLVLVGLFVVVAVTIGRLLVQMFPLYDRLQTATDRVNRILREQIAGVRVVRAFVQDRREHARFAGANRELHDPGLRLGYQMATFPALVTLVMNVFAVGLVWLGAGRVDAGLMPLGVLTAVLGYLALIVLSMVMTIVVITGAARARTSVARLTEVLDAPVPEQPRVPSFPTVGPADGGRVELRGVGHVAPGAERPMLDGVDLTVAPGETVAVLGGTGSGKSTLLSLVVRLLDPTSGSVRVDDVDVREMDPDELARRVGLVPQTAQLFAGTVATNLRFGAPAATDEQLWDALAAVRADELVRGLPDGLESAVSPDGRNLSGGQRQRLALARTLLRRPRVYLLDDCFSALDTTTEREVRAGLAARTGGATVLLVTQRVATAATADRIVVLDGGRMVACGDHDTLLREDPVFAEIVRSQQAVAEPVVGGLR